jgi:hypothetical protein
VIFIAKRCWPSSATVAGYKFVWCRKNKQYLSSNRLPECES